MTDYISRRYFGIIIFVSFGILFIPQLFYISNIFEFDGDIILLFVPVLASIVFVVLVSILPRGQRIQLVLAGLGLSIFLCDLILRADIGRLDGSSGDIPLHLATAVPNALLYVGLPLVFLFLGSRIAGLLANLAFVAAVLALGLTSYSTAISFMGTSGKAAEQAGSRAGGEVNTAENQRPNIYFIWLDAMETGYMKKYLAETRNADAFRGFTFFVNNSANYFYTLQSYASFMSGTVYKGGDYKDWSNKGLNLRKDLDALGYRMTSYAKRDFLSSLDDAAYGADDIFLKATRSRHPYVADFVTYWLVRSAPAIVANESLRYGRRLGNLIHDWVNPASPYSAVKSISDGIEPLTGVFVLRRFISDESTRAGFNEFVIAHAVLPHGPYVIDRNCAYRGRTGTDPKDAYFDQTVCAMDMVKKFLQKLKELGRYDKSMIIIMGDHGSGWAGLIDGVTDGSPPLNGKFTPWTRSMLVSRASAALMVKPPKSPATDPMAVSLRESQLVDLYPTILSLIGQEAGIAGDIDGINLFGPEQPGREKTILYFRPAREINAYEAEIYDLTMAPGGGLTDIVYRAKFRDPDKIRNIECGRPIEFSKATRDGEYYSADGLSGFEAHGRWSDGNLVTLKFRLPQTRCEAASVALSLRGFVNAKNPLQSGMLKLNGAPLGRVEIHAGQANPAQFTFELPAPAVKWGEFNELTLDIDRPVSPKSLGMSNDQRLLGFGFHTLEFR